MIMKRMLATMTVAIGFAAIAAAQPKLEVVGGETYDWGKVKPPKEGFLEAEIRLKNVGSSGQLKLVEIRPGCGCTKTDPDKTELGPGEVSTMKVKLNISPSQSGPLTKSITIRSSGGTDTVTSYLFLKADVTRALQLKPQTYLAFSDMKVGQESKATIELVNNDPADITITDVKTENGLIVDIPAKRTLKPGEVLNITALITPSQKGQYSSKVTFKTTHPDHPTMDIQAYGMVMEATSPVFQKESK